MPCPFRPPAAQQRRLCAPAPLVPGHTRTHTRSTHTHTHIIIIFFSLLLRGRALSRVGREAFEPVCVHTAPRANAQALFLYTVPRQHCFCSRFLWFRKKEVKVHALISLVALISLARAIKKATARFTLTPHRSLASHSKGWPLLVPLPALPRARNTLGSGGPVRNVRFSIALSTFTAPCLRASAAPPRRVQIRFKTPLRNHRQ